MCLSFHTAYSHLSACQTSGLWKLANISILHDYDTILIFLFKSDSCYLTLGPSVMCSIGG